jgi:flagellar assembly factor FliW
VSAQRPRPAPRAEKSSRKAFVAMQISTSRFGPIEIDVDDILLFPQGVVAFEECQHWVLLADDANDSLGWLQSVAHEHVALPVVSPRRLVPDYQVHLNRGQLLPLEFSQFDQAYVLVVVSQSDGDLTLNLKAPLVINLDRRLGRQVITAAEDSVAHLIAPSRSELRKSA